MEYHPVVKTILSLLMQHGVWIETFEHVAVRTSEEAAQVRHGYGLSQGAKALIVRIKVPFEGKKFIMVVVPGNAKFSNAKLKEVAGATDIRFATPEEVREITHGIEPGGVPPFGNLFGLTVFVDTLLFSNEKIIFNAGDRRFSVAMKAEDYKMIVQPHCVSIVERQ